VLASLGGTGAAVILGGCAKNTPVKTQSEADAADAQVVASLLEQEQRAIAAYAHVARALSGKDRALAKQIAAQERRHADLLSGIVKRLGGAPPAESAFSFPQLARGADALRFASDLENSSIALYIDALPKIANALVRGTAASIAANEAQHVALLAVAQGLPPAPVALVVGRR
jgi:rubrerythrin